MNKVKIGVISDTHGLLRHEAVNAFRDSEMIIHAGDIGAPEVIDNLRKIAPVTAVRGNMDTGKWAEKYPLTEVVKAGGKYLYVLHEIGSLGIAPAASGFHVVIYGHSHKPKEEIKNGVIYLNPGSAGPGRFSLPVSAARIVIDDDTIKTTIIKLR